MVCVRVCMYDTRARDVCECVYMCEVMMCIELFIKFCGFFARWFSFAKKVACVAQTANCSILFERLEYA